MAAQQTATDTVLRVRSARAGGMPISSARAPVTAPKSTGSACTPRSAASSSRPAVPCGRPRSSSSAVRSSATRSSSMLSRLRGTSASRSECSNQPPSVTVITFRASVSASNDAMKSTSLRWQVRGWSATRTS